LILNTDISLYLYRYSELN